MKNDYRIDNAIAIIDVDGVPYQIDAEDFEKVSRWSWCQSVGYARSHAGSLHRFVMSAPPGSVIDHINHDKTDNRKANLRITNQSVNARNRKVTKNVHFNKPMGKWQVYFKINYVNTFFGYYETEQAALLVANEIRPKLLRGETVEGMKRKFGVSGVRGVNYNKLRNVWIARGGHGLDRKFLGAFETIEQAERAVKQFEGEHERNTNSDS